MQIRLFQTSDTNQVTDIIQRNLREVNIRDYTSSEIETTLNQFTLEQVERNANIRTVFVATEVDLILGTAGYAPSNNPEIDGVFLLTVFTHPEYHGQGIGKKLVEAIEYAAKNDGFEAMYVPSSRTAIGFYQRLGYDFVDSQSKENSEGITLMYKKL